MVEMRQGDCQLAETFHRSVQNRIILATRFRRVFLSRKCISTGQLIQLIHVLFIITDQSFFIVTNFAHLLRHFLSALLLRQLSDSIRRHNICKDCTQTEHCQLDYAFITIFQMRTDNLQFTNVILVILQYQSRGRANLDLFIGKREYLFTVRYIGTTFLLINNLSIITIKCLISSYNVLRIDLLRVI